MFAPSRKAEKPGEPRREDREGAEPGSPFPRLARWLLDGGGFGGRQRARGEEEDEGDEDGVSNELFLPAYLIILPPPQLFRLPRKVNKLRRSFWQLKIILLAVSGVTSDSVTV